MNTSGTSLANAWSRIGGICGIASIVCYLCAAFAPVPESATLALGFAFGPLLAIGFQGLGYRLGEPSNAPSARLAAMFGMAAGSTVLLMLCMQQAVFISMRETIQSTTVASAKSTAVAVLDGLNLVQLGVDVAWDVLISIAMIFASIAMWTHQRFGKLVAVPGLCLAVLLVTYNLYYFPTPPYDSDSIDWGPFCALWLLVVFAILTLSSRSKRAVRHDTAEAG